MRFSWNSRQLVVVLYALAAILFIIGIFDASYYTAKQSERSEIRQSGQKTTAVAINRKELLFRTPKGEITGRPLVGPATGTLQAYDLMEIYYDKDNPQKFVLAQSDSAYSITMWIAALKLFGVSIVVAALGYKKQRELLKKSHTAKAA